MAKEKTISVIDIGSSKISSATATISENRINAEDYYDKTYEDPEQAIIDYNKMEEESEMDDYNNLGND